MLIHIYIYVCVSVCVCLYTSLSGISNHFHIGERSCVFHDSFLQPHTGLSDLDAGNHGRFSWRGFDRCMEALLFPALCSQFFLISSYKFHCNVVFGNESKFPRGGMQSAAKKCAQAAWGACQQRCSRLSGVAGTCGHWKHPLSWTEDDRGMLPSESCGLVGGPIFFIGMCRHMG